ncbi:MAG: sporulation protein YunB [Clostridia bacterium]
MDKIYSRRRIQIPNFIIKKTWKHPNSPENKKRVKWMRMMTILIVAFITVNVILQAISPILDEQCKNLAKSIATKISNEQATNVMNRYRYDDLCNVTKDSNGNISMLSSNVIVVNEIISDVAVKIQEELNKTDNETFYIPLGSFTGSKLLSGRGPKISFQMSTIGNIETNLRSEFSSAGINQTLHRIYLEVNCKVIILTPYHTVEEQIINQVLLAEAVIVGTTPNTYYNLEGMTKDNATNIIE